MVTFNGNLYIFFFFYKFMETKKIDDNLIIETIRNSNTGISTVELAKKLKIERHTLMKYLEILKTKGLISYKQYGRTKVWFESKSPVISLFESNDELSVQVKNLINSLDEGISIADENMRIIWTSDNMKDFMNLKYESNIGITCHKAFNNTDDICDTCPAQVTFNKGIENTSVALMNGVNGKEEFEIKIVPIKGSNGQVVGIIEKFKKI